MLEFDLILVKQLFHRRSYSRISNLNWLNESMKHQSSDERASKETENKQSVTQYVWLRLRQSAHRSFDYLPGKSIILSLVCFFSIRLKRDGSDCF